MIVKSFQCQRTYSFRYFACLETSIDIPQIAGSITLCSRSPVVNFVYDLEPDITLRLDPWTSERYVELLI